MVDVIASIRELLSEYEAEIQKLRSEAEKIMPGAYVEVKYVRCGRAACKKCPHGPYYYLRYRDRESGRLRSKYLGSSPEGRIREASLRRLLKLERSLWRAYQTLLEGLRTEPSHRLSRKH